MAQAIVEASRLDELRNGFAGEIIVPGEPAYDEARTIFNAMIDRRPGVIAQCANVRDVASAIRFGRDLGLEIAVRGGGHGVAGKALTDGGIVIDLRQMNDVSVNADARTARVGGGATMSHLDRACEPYGLATTGGRVSTTGVGGFTLGGGSGWLDRKFGLACDNLLEVELVTADGSVVRASETEHPELFWALHGGGGNFGVATSLTFRLYSVPSMTAAFLFWTPEAGAELVSAYRDFIEAAPDDVGGGLVYVTAAPEPFMPADMVGKLAIMVLVTYTGAEAEGRAAIAPILARGHTAEMIAEMPYADLQCAIDDPPGYRLYWSAEYLNAFPDEAVAAFAARAHDMPVPSPSQHVLFPQGGAVARGPGDYPIPWRSAQWIVHPFGVWEDPADDQRVIQWTHDVRADVKPWATGDVYLNFIGDEGHDRLLAGYGRENYERLARVKEAYDPDNVFRLNQNITPAKA